MNEDTIIMDNIIYLDIERLPSGKCQEDTRQMLTGELEVRYPNALRVDFKRRETRGKSAVFCFRVWINDPENISIQKASE
jgi:hypothetical protein